MVRHAIRPQPKRELMRIFLIALCFAIWVAAGCADPELGKSQSIGEQATKAPEAKWPDKNTPEGKFAGRYWMARGPVDKVEKISMTLQPNMTCLLSVEYVRSHTPTKLYKGTWKATNDAATCTFTEIAGVPGNSVFIFRNEGNGFVSTQWDKANLGDEPLKFQRASGGPMGAR